MRANTEFLKLPKRFWANVRSISEALGYTEAGRRRGQGRIKVYTPSQVQEALSGLGLGSEHLYSHDGSKTEIGIRLHRYFEHRAEVLNTFVEPRLMDADAARNAFEELRDRQSYTCLLPRNKQRGEKAGYAYLTGIVNMIVESSIGTLPCNYNPYSLTTFQRDGQPVRTLARRVDGCFPDVVNPIALWEIKEYYFTTTFGSRVADGVYETLLDGLELEELRENELLDCYHMLVVDSHFTWWMCGKSYLCRIVDMLHMGYVDEVLFGREVLERLPEITSEWVREYHTRRASDTTGDANGKAYGQ